jgi:glyoxylase-like metal-dependent hydrolase (beta-lactamase superfamily II)
VTEGDLYLEQLECGPMANFVYLVGSRSTREVAIVDPAWAVDALLDHVEARDLTPVAALVTHYHQDHVGGEMYGQRIEGLAELIGRRGMKIYVNRLEADGLRSVTGVSESDLVRVGSGDTVRIGEVELEFLHTPGHTPGSQCFLARQALVAGDTLFVRGCGRVDLPGSSPDDMFDSMRKLASLPDETVLYPGHNYAEVPTALLGEEKQKNPYLRIPTREMWREMMGGG